MGARDDRRDRLDYSQGLVEAFSVSAFSKPIRQSGASRTADGRCRAPTCVRTRDRQALEKAAVAPRTLSRHDWDRPASPIAIPALDADGSAARAKVGCHAAARRHEWGEGIRRRQNAQDRACDLSNCGAERELSAALQVNPYDTREVTRDPGSAFDVAAGARERTPRCADSQAQRYRRVDAPLREALEQACRPRTRACASQAMSGELSDCLLATLELVLSGRSGSAPSLQVTHRRREIFHPVGGHACM